MTRHSLEDWCRKMSARMWGRQRFITQGCTDRQRLSASAVPGAKVVLYRAPPGYGKSVQVALAANIRDPEHESAVYINRRSYPDARDVTDSLFAALVLYQLEGPESRGALKSDTDTIEALRDALFNAKKTIRICLDGPGEGADNGDLIEDLICETPGNVKFFIAPGSTGALPRLSLMTGVVTYGADELAFTEEELEELGEVTGIDGLEAGNMIQATGGWPALVRLMCQTPNPDLPPASWPETRSYFRDNLLSVLPDNARRFVCNAAMLEEISAECYDYVYKTQQADQEISFLNEKFALLAPTASSGKRLTMHPVLREYLRSVFSATQRERRSYVLKRVAFWHWRRGEYLHSINVALEASDHRWARVVSDSIILDVALRQGEIEVLRTWFEKVPARTIKKIASLSIGYAWTLYFSQQARQAEEMLASSRHPISRGLGSLDEEGWRELVKAIGKATHDELPESQALCEKWIDAFGDRNMVGKGAALTCQAFIASSDRRFEELEELLHRAAVANQSSNQLYAFIWLKTAEIQTELFKGDMVRAMYLLRQANKTAEKIGVPKSFLNKMLGVLELQILLEQDHHQVSPESAQISFDFALNYGVTDILWGCTQTCSRLLYHQGFRDRAMALLEQARLAASERELPRLNILTKVQLAEFTLLNNEELEPPILPDESELTFTPNQNRAIQAHIALVRSMYRLRLGKQFGVAGNYAREALQAASAISDARTRVAAQYCQALAAFALGSSKPAKRMMLDANLHAEHLNCHFTPLWIKEALLSLSPLARNLFDDLPDTAEAATTKDPEVRAGDLSAAPVPGHTDSVITVRQISILKCISNGMTNKAIAERLLVTEDAVKWHLKKIFSELGVTNRVQAVTEARLRGLL
ncbi:transcriptional regulator [Marinobacter sp. EVN1]|nr:transcriptional regulator [Marinobacter sp. EVN1]